MMKLRLISSKQRITSTVNSLLLLVVLGMLLSACSTHTVKNTTPPPLLESGTPVVIPDIDVLQVTPAMNDFLATYVLGYDDENVKRQLLSLALTSRAMLGFHYNEERTLTAKQAFETRSGNCIGFANLFIALAREAGLSARYHEVLIPPEWSSQDDMFVISKHINVVVDSPQGLFEVDISGREIKLDAKRRIMTDNEAFAMYLNNMGVGALFAGDLSTAYAYLIKAIEVAPTVADSWSNLGVVLGRNEQYRDAETAYRTALMVNPGEHTAMGNLYDLYVQEDNLEAAELLATRVERYRRENPYYLLLLSDEAIQRQDFRESIDLLKRAIKKKEDEHRLHFAMARAQYLSGRIEEAQSSLQRAKELVPAEQSEEYDRPMNELLRMEEFGSLQ
jgi:Flp pilus assembly protein TadD